MANKKELLPEQRAALLELLSTRFEKNNFLNSFTFDGFHRVRPVIFGLGDKTG